MTDIAEPVVHRRSAPSVVWLIPVVTALVGAWLIYTTLADQGPVATISFKTAEGIEVGKTAVKYKSMDIGVVEGMQFGEGFANVVLTVQFSKGMDSFLRRNTRFWVVKPQLSVRGVTGLETLISGSYIEIDPGPGAEQRHFVGLERQPLVTAGEAGKRLTLISDKLGSIDAGSPVYYQGILAGEALGYELASDARSVYIHIFVREPFDHLVRGNTRFWNVSGIDMSLGADGIDVRTASLTSMLFGGIAFDTPDSLAYAPGDVEDLIFTLYDSRDEIEARTYTRKLRYVMYFDGSVRGLAAGAPVEFKGLPIGTVLDVRLEFEPADTSFRIPVLVEIEPERIIERAAQSATPPEQTIAKLVESGLRGRLQTGNLLTGSLYVDMNMYPDAPLELKGAPGGRYPELPTIPGSIEAITATLEDFVAQLDSVDLAGIAKALQGTLEGTDALLNTRADGDPVTDLQTAMRSLRNLLTTLDESNVGETVEAANSVLRSVNRTLELANASLAPNAPLQYGAVAVLSELEETARAIRALVEMLERQPQSLLLGRDPEAQ